MPDPPKYLTKVYIILNPMAGNCDADRVRRTLEQKMSAQWAYTIYETTGEECLADVIRQQIDQGYELFVAVGGDGTVSGVADGLAQTGLPLGIIPLGTGNALARELKIPQELDQALQILAGKQRTIIVDALKLEQRFFVLDISVGFSSFLMRETGRWSKQRFGRLAYVWTGIRQFIGFQPERFTLTVDGRSYRFRAAQVTVTNARIMGASPFQWGPHIKVDDGQLDLCIVRAWSLFSYIRLAWNLVWCREAQDPTMRYLPVTQEAVVDAERVLPVQADGESIGQTPVHVHVAPQILRVIIPASRE